MSGFVLPLAVATFKTTTPSAFPSVGLPTEAIGILIALDVFPDVARTPANVTADPAVATIVARRERPQLTMAAAA